MYLFERYGEQLMCGCNVQDRQDDFNLMYIAY